MLVILRSRTLHAYVRNFLDYVGWRALVLALLILAGALLEGIGIVLLIPFIVLLTDLDASVGIDAKSKMTQSMLDILAAVGLEQTITQVIGVLIAFVFLAVLRGFVLWQRDILSASLTLSFVDQTRIRLFRALSSAPWSTVSYLRHAAVQHVITSDISRISAGSELMIRGSISLLFFLAYLVLAIVLSFKLTILVLAFLAIAALLLRPLQSRARKLGEDMSRLGESVYEVLGSFMSGLKLAKSINAEGQFVDEFERNVNALRQSQIRFSRDQVGARILFQTSGYLVVSCVVAIGLFVTQTPLPVLIALIVIFSRLSGPFLAIQQSFQSIAQMLPAFATYESLLVSLEQAPNEIELLKTTDIAQNHLPAPFLAGAVFEPAEVKCDRITFIRNADDEPLAVLDEFSLTIALGETLAVVGPSGAGKTTFADILVGLLTPTRGEVLVGNQCLVPSNIAAWRSAISYVPQDPFLFDRSVRKNLTWAVPSATDHDIWRSLEISGAEEFVRSLPNGLDTRVGERGNLFSGGERQRICLARALLRKPLLMVLDEATNALDLDSEREFLAVVSKMRSEMSIVVVSHRLSSLSVVDRIAVMSDGRIVETGSFDELTKVTNSRFSIMLSGKSDHPESV